MRNALLLIELLLMGLLLMSVWCGAPALAPSGN